MPSTHKYSEENSPHSLKIAEEITTWDVVSIGPYTTNKDLISTTIQIT